MTLTCLRFSKIWSVTHAAQGSRGTHNLFGESKGTPPNPQTRRQHMNLPCIFARPVIPKDPALLYENVSQSKFPVLGGVICDEEKGDPSSGDFGETM